MQTTAAAQTGRSCSTQIRSKLREQLPAREHIQQRLKLWVQPWQSCACSHYTCKGCKKAPVHCPVHGKPNRGVQQLVKMLQKAMPAATIYAEVPLLSQGNQGRALMTGQFTGNKQGDLLLDVLVQSPEGLLHAIEVCGKEHQTRPYTIKGDQKKAQLCGTLHLPLISVWLTAQGVPSGSWSAAVQTVKHTLCM